MRGVNDGGTSDLTRGRWLLGYARVSTDHWDLTNQRAELYLAGSTWISQEIIGMYRDRTEPAKMPDHLRAGNVVTVTRLDWLALFLNLYLFA